MIIFVLPVGKNIDIFVFDGKSFISTESIQEPGKEFEVFPEKITQLLNTFTIDGILLITGPGSFTRLRILTLAINSIHLVHPEIPIRGIGFFDFCRETGASEPYILDANRHEYLVSRGGSLSFIKKGELPTGTYFGFGQESDFTERNISVQYSHTPEVIYKVYQSLGDTDTLSPLYIKEPNITCPK